ncbi:MAG: polyprenyl synthetase family protein [candidate division Zixibacteria bacterium]|jgi:octaprenyl-diphosphate synthase|nr:polyprenyl synthetase family protein [candidate division Zixibacteria bacterium]
MDGDKLKSIVKPVEEDLALFDSRLVSFLTGDSPLITSIAQHLMKSKGKRIRPAILFLSARAAGFFTEHTINGSLGIELIHTATLLHDDVVDDADLRRGNETVNHKWTNLIAVLMGDYLFAKAFKILLKTESMELIDAISNATERVSIGELRQVEETSNYDLSEEEYMKIITDKTASLFAVSCAAGPILARKNGNIREKFTYFGEKIGTAFQIADDLLDYVGDAVVTGKEPGNDVITGKVTLPLIYSLRHGEKDKNREIMRLLGNGVKKREFHTILKYVTESGGIDYAYRRAAEISREGWTAVGGLKDSAYYRSLQGMVDYSTLRVG